MRIAILALVVSPFVTNASALADPGGEKRRDYDIEMRSEDVISPVSIEHKVDDLFDHGELQRSYNYLDYRFERDGAYIRARAYLYEIESVSIYGPFAISAPHEPVRNDELYRFVLEYLKRRFSVIESLSSDEPDGYKVILPPTPPADE